MANYNVSGLITLAELANSNKNSWYVYILKCSDDTYYTGITKNIKPSIDKRRGPSFQVIDHSEDNFRASIPPNKRGVLSLRLNWKSQKVKSL